MKPENPERLAIGSGMRLRVKLLLSAVTFILFFVLLELVLALAGVRPFTAREDPYVGFSSGQPLFRPAESGEKYETAPSKLALFNAQSFDRSKRAGTYRIFTLGGSTTYGRPLGDATSFSGWLEAYLSTLPGEREWEVVNAGVISYASYRVSHLMEELVRYEPDLFVVYSGNNEFLERRTYGGLIEEPRLLVRARELLQRFRLWTVGRSLLAGRSGKPRERYELTGEVQELLDRSAGLDYYERNESFRRSVLEHYRFNLQRMIDLAQDRGAGVILVTIPVNEKNFAPFKSQHAEHVSAEAGERCDALLAGAREALEQGRDDDALRLAEQAVELDPLYAEAHFVLGRSLLAAGLGERADRAFAAALKQDVRLPEAHVGRGKVLLARGDLRRAIEAFETAAHHDPGHVESHEMLARGLAMDSRFVEARQALRRGIQQNPGSVRLLMLDGQILAQSGDFFGAARAFTQAIDLEPSLVEPWVELGAVQMAAGRYAEAAETCRRGLAAGMEDGELHHILANALLLMNRVEEAQTHLEQALRADPRNAQAASDLAAVHELYGRWAEALELYRTAARLDPNLDGVGESVARVSDLLGGG